MKVNFNNLRKQTAFCYDTLAKKLNMAVEYNQLDEQVIEDIQEDMDSLRSYVMWICGVYIEGDEDFKDVSEEVGEIAWFNEEKESE